MKKKTTFLYMTLCTAVLSLGLMSCGGQVKTGEENDSTTLEATETGMAPAAVENVDVVKGELGLFDLRGPVKTCKTTAYGNTIVNEFDENGFVTVLNGQPLSKVFPIIQRDAEGRMQHCSYDQYDETHCDYTVNEAGLVVEVEDWPYMDGGSIIKYTYDDNGDRTQMHVEELGMDAEEPYTENYTINERDSHGNWTKRTSGSNVETRVITYYE